MLDRPIEVDKQKIETISQIGRSLGTAWVPRPRYTGKRISVDGDIMVADSSLALENALARLIDDAEEMVVLCSFLFASDRLMLALENASFRGVRVYMMLASEARLAQERGEDAFSRRCREDHEEMLRRLGPRVMIRSAAHYHAKTLLIDPNGPNAQGLLLTANLTNEALKRNEELGVRMTPGEVSSVFAELRYAIWERADHQMIGSDFRAVEQLETVEPPSASIALATSPPHCSIRDTALELIEKAEQRIIVSSFGWALDHPIVLALIARAKTGLKVMVLARIRKAAMPALAALAKAGAAVYGFRWLHAKAIWTDSDCAMIMSANLENHGMDDGFELGIRLEGSRAESLRRILEEWAGTAEARLDPAAVIAPDVENVQLWENGDLKEVEIPANLSVDLGSVTMRSLTDPLPERPKLPDKLPLARTLSVRWNVNQPCVDNKAILIDVKGKEVKKAQDDTSPISFPALMREPSGRRVVVISDLAQLDEAESLADICRAKAVVFNRSAT